MLPTIICDSREHEGHAWSFNKSKYFAGTKIDKLEDGDVSIDVFVDKKYLYCDRKKTLSELASNLFGKADKERFHECLERAREYKWKFIIVEQNLSDIFHCQSLKRMGMRPESLLKRLIELYMEYGICVVFAGKNGHMFCLSLLKRIYNKWLEDQTKLEIVTTVKNIINDAINDDINDNIDRKITKNYKGKVLLKGI